MKRIAIILSLILSSLFAQSQPEPRPQPGPGPFAPEGDIVGWLNLEKQTEDRFVKEYSSFKKEIDEVFRNSRPPQHLTDEAEIDKAIQQNFYVSEKILQIRKKYYSVFKEFMKPSQIQRLYHMENEAGRRMHHHDDGPGRPGGPGDPGERPNGQSFPGRP